VPIELIPRAVGMAAAAGGVVDEDVRWEGEGRGGGREIQVAIALARADPSDDAPH